MFIRCHGLFYIFRYIMLVMFFLVVGLGTLHRRWLSDETVGSYKSAESYLSCHDIESHSGNEATFLMGSTYLADTTE